MITKRHKIERTKKIAFWTPHITAWRTSGLGATAYCRQHDLSLHKFKYWQYQIAKVSLVGQKTSESTISKPTEFVEVSQQPKKLPIPSTLSNCEIVSQHGFSIVLIHDLLPMHLQNVLLTLKTLS